MALGVPFEGVRAESGISRTRMNFFYHEFTRWMSDAYYSEAVRPPQTIEEVKRAESVYSKLGLPGCVSSMDGVHLAWDNCPSERYNIYKGKEGYPTVSFNVHCDHSTRIFSIHGPHAGSRNDKAMVRLDAMASAVKNKSLFNEYEYTLQGARGAVHRRKGCWILCDGGYHKWLHTISPMKRATIRDQQVWSKRYDELVHEYVFVLGATRNQA